MEWQVSKKKQKSKFSSTFELLLINLFSCVESEEIYIHLFWHIVKNMIMIKKYWTPFTQVQSYPIGSDRIPDTKVILKKNITTKQVSIEVIITGEKVTTTENIPLEVPDT